MNETSAPPMIEDAKPLCPRDNHLMHFEAHSIAPDIGKAHAPFTAAYHCNFYHCNVRFNMTEGYFTVESTLDNPYFVDEPGTNLFQCPRHGTWLYRCENENKDGEKFVWRCASQGCDYIRADVGGAWLRE